MSRRHDIEVSDAIWRAERADNEWVLPSAAPWPLRLPVIRWFRFAVSSTAVHRAAAQWAGGGIGIGGPNQYDLWVLWAIYRGWV